LKFRYPPLSRHNKQNAFQLLLEGVAPTNRPRLDDDEDEDEDDGTLEDMNGLIPSGV
jgi:hypothetical protein